MISWIPIYQHLWVSCVSLNYRSRGNHQLILHFISFYIHSKNLMQYSLRATQTIEDEIGSWSKACHKTTHYHSKTLRTTPAFDFCSRCDSSANSPNFGINLSTSQLSAIQERIRVFKSISFHCNRVKPTKTPERNRSSSLKMMPPSSTCIVA